MSYPAEGVIRILKGSFPDLKMSTPVCGRILDLGCGDGRHFPLFAQIGLTAYGTEISSSICEKLIKQLNELKIPFSEILKGTTNCLPFEDMFFDYLLTWNSCYYMSVSETLDFTSHVAEMARVLKKNGWIICSIPKKSSFIFKGSTPAKVAGYRVLAKDPWGTREGEIMRCFETRNEVESEFSKWFTGFCHADIDMEWFGLSYHWHVFVARRI
jgi:ubiquinone/menaquinone biosynthesis C-methylase UbiE